MKTKKTTVIKDAPAAKPAPAVLLPYQQTWVADKADVEVWEKSRRIGASWCDASDAVLTAGVEGGSGTGEGSCTRSPGPAGCTTCSRRRWNISLPCRQVPSMMIST